MCIVRERRPAGFLDMKCQTCFHSPRPFEGHMTSWLQIALQYNQDMRGGRRVATEDAPCLTNMEHILDTQVCSLKISIR